MKTNSNILKKSELLKMIEEGFKEVAQEMIEESGWKPGDNGGNELPTYDQLLLALEDLYMIGRRIGASGGSWEANMEQARNALQGAARNGKNLRSMHVTPYVFKGD